jgi:uncharacterized membrane protein (UPF0127 family)
MKHLIKSQKIIFAVFISITLLVTFSFLFYKLKTNINYLNGGYTENHVVINDKIIKVDVMDEYAGQVQGLSDKESIDYDAGMLFDFQNKQTRRFWMKNMHFPIDIIWIDDDTVVGISRNCEPEGEEPVKRYSSIVPVNYVLEVNAGFSDEFGIEEGDTVEFKY